MIICSLIYLFVANNSLWNFILWKYNNETYFNAEFCFNEEHNRLQDTETMQQ